MYVIIDYLYRLCADPDFYIIILAIWNFKCNFGHAQAFTQKLATNYIASTMKPYCHRSDRTN